ncbi:hypothetical protein [Alkaliflexus imshenetskii]|uniref:hypothetical protein n=1 Tax=Alkaliflexus imshenetskii TaxID=286730 RepID=UPI00047D13E0|nr:hypothetical protein [Alkaliflexus imshenetskii]
MKKVVLVFGVIAMMFAGCAGNSAPKAQQEEVVVEYEAEEALVEVADEAEEIAEEVAENIEEAAE